MGSNMGMRFSTDHEWVLMKDGVALIGISEYAQNALGDIVYVDLPDVGTDLTAGSVIGSVESVKAVADFLSPVSGEVTAVNEELQDAPELLNEDPYANWMLTVIPSDENELDNLMDEEAYEEFCKNL